jgi:uncharacterized protein (TIGR04255 family)
LAVRILPEFNKPPVVEVAISVYFRPLGGMKTVHFGQFWEANRERYPKFEDALPLIENVNDLSQIGDLMQIGSLKRVFMVTADDRYVMQVQQNAFVHNWRKIKDTDGYPRFESARKIFRDQFEVFKGFVATNNLGPLSATRYEVTYVNHIFEDKGTYSAVLDKYASILCLQPASKRELLPEPRTMNSDIWFDLPQDAGTLKVSFKEVTRAVDKRSVLQLEMTAGGKAMSDFSSFDSWLDVAHEWIVRGFAEITTPDAHNQWEKTT